MPNLHDVIELNPVPKLKSAVKSSITSFNKALQLLGPAVSKPTLDILVKDLEAGMKKRRQTLFEEGFELSPDMSDVPKLHHSQGVISQGYSSEDRLARLAGRRKTTIGKLKQTADMLNMVIMPYEALNPQSVRNAGYSQSVSVHAFLDHVAGSGIEFDCYVVAPLSLYHLESHVKSKTQGWMYSSVHETTLTTIALQLPMFRSLSSAVESLDRRVSELESFRQTLSVQMTELSTRLSDLENKVAEQTRVRAEEAAVRAAGARLRVEEERMWVALDPLLFAVKRGSKTDDSLAIVGPAWGPDFSESLLEISGLSVIPGQRASLSEPDRR